MVIGRGPTHVAPSVRVGAGLQAGTQVDAFFVGADQRVQVVAALSSGWTEIQGP
jgi:hypothetical protein